MATGAPLSLHYHSDQLSNKVASVLHEFYVTGEFCDVILHVGNINIQAHRIVLAALSPYFRELFHQSANKHKMDIMLGNHLREEYVRQLVDFCYSSHITVDSSSADKILMTAKYLQIKEIEKLCVTFLAAQQALKSEVIQQQVSPMLMQAGFSTMYSSTLHKTKESSSNLHELACADTSGIGSSNTSPRQSSRPNSEPSGNGSVIIQPLDDQDVDVEDVKKELENSPSVSGQPFFPSSSSFSWNRLDFENFRSGLPKECPMFFFPPMASSFLSPVTTSVQHQLLMKALTKTVESPREHGEVDVILSGKNGNAGHVKDESSPLDTVESNTAETLPHKCHICFKLHESVSALKTHVLCEHQEHVTLSGMSPFKMRSPLQKFSSETTNINCATTQKEPFGGNNVCGTCGKSFRDPQSLKFHCYNHVLRYQCNYCGKRFSRSWNLHRHRKTHYHQLEESGLGSDEVHAIDVDKDNSSPIEATASPAFDSDKDAILTSPYADYRTHRRDMMPFAFDMRSMAPSSTLGNLDSKSSLVGNQNGDNNVLDMSVLKQDKKKSVNLESEVE